MNSSYSATWPSCAALGWYSFSVQYGGDVTTKCTDSFGMNDKSLASPWTIR